MVILLPLKEIRGTMPPIPKNFIKYLTLEQEVALRSLGHFGWRLNFIRRPPFRDPTVVLRSRLDDQIISVLEKDGRINHSPLLELRH